MAIHNVGHLLLHVKQSARDWRNLYHDFTSQIGHHDRHGKMTKQSTLISDAAVAVEPKSSSVIACTVLASIQLWRHMRYHELLSDAQSFKINWIYILTVLLIYPLKKVLCESKRYSFQIFSAEVNGKVFAKREEVSGRWRHDLEHGKTKTQNLMINTKTKQWHDKIYYIL